MAFKSFFNKKNEEEKKRSPQHEEQPSVDNKTSPIVPPIAPPISHQTRSVEKNKLPVEENNPIVSNEEPPVARQLEKAMADNLRQDTPDSRSRVYQELLFSDLLLALVDSSIPPTQPASPETPQSLNVAIMSNPQGIQFAAAFTSADAAKRWRAEGGQYVSIRGQEIFKLLEPSPASVIVVNPGSNPFVTLNKADYHSLAQGVVPQSAQSPVQAPPQGENQQEGMQISFPPDAFTESQRQNAKDYLSKVDNIEAVALGALLPPNAADENSWLRTIFLRTKVLQKNQEEIQKFCIDLRDKMSKNLDSFADVQFEVGVMPDTNFWVAVNQNNFCLFDKNPPKNPPSITPLGARKA